MPKQKNKTKVKESLKKSESKRKRLYGVVVSKKMRDTIVVKVEANFTHPTYKKILIKKKKYKVHCTRDVELGDEVVIEQTKPVSKEKCWRLVETRKK